MITQSEVQQLEQRLRQAMLDSNVDELNTLLSDDLIFTNHMGGVMGKVDDLAAHETGTVKIQTLTLSDQRIQCLETVAIVSVCTKIHGIFSGVEAEAMFRFMRVWAPDSKGAWQVISAQSTLVAEGV